MPAHPAPRLLLAHQAARRLHLLCLSRHVKRWRDQLLIPQLPHTQPPTHALAAAGSRTIIHVHLLPPAAARPTVHALPAQGALPPSPPPAPQAHGDPIWLAVGHASGAVVVWDLHRRPARQVAFIGGSPLAPCVASGVGMGPQASGYRSWCLLLHHQSLLPLSPPSHPPPGPASTPTRTPFLQCCAAVAAHLSFLP